MKNQGIRCRIDGRSEKIGKKIRDAELAKIPYMLIIGAREAENDQVSLRKRGQGDLGTVPVADLIAEMRREITYIT
jgi:threonyl-tRNA synthetase